MFFVSLAFSFKSSNVPLDTLLELLQREVLDELSVIEQPNCITERSLPDFKHQVARIRRPQEALYAKVGCHNGQVRVVAGIKVNLLVFSQICKDIFEDIIHFEKIIVVIFMLDFVLAALQEFSLSKEFVGNAFSVVTGKTLPVTEAGDHTVVDWYIALVIAEKLLKVLFMLAVFLVDLVILFRMLFAVFVTFCLHVHHMNVGANICFHCFNVCAFEEHGKEFFSAIHGSSVKDKQEGKEIETYGIVVAAEVNSPSLTPPSRSK